MLLCDEDDEVVVARGRGVVVIALNDDVAEAGLLPAWATDALLDAWERCRPSQHSECAGERAV